MPSRAYFVNKTTGEEFEIIEFNAADQTVTLKGKMSTITEPYDKARVEAMGYTLKLVDDAPAAPVADEDE